MEAYPIEGVRTYPLRIIDVDRGAVLHMLRTGHEAFDQFGEAYFSEVLPGVTKGWKRHIAMTQRLSVPVGEVIFGLKDGRATSPTLGAFMTIRLGRPDHYKLLVIPPGIWYAFRNPASVTSLIANLPDLPHDPQEIQREPVGSPEFADVGEW